MVGLFWFIDMNYAADNESLEIDAAFLSTEPSFFCVRRQSPSMQRCLEAVGNSSQSIG